MYNSDALIDMHERAQRNLVTALAHCRELSSEQLNHDVPGFGYSTVRLQLHHVIGAEKYWLGVLEGRIDAEDDAPDYPSIESLETYRQQVSTMTEAYLGAASQDELNVARPVLTWGDQEQALIPARVVLRTITHTCHHLGQIAAMCRLLGKPSSGWDFPIK